MYKEKREGEMTKEKGIKLYECQKCNKKVVADDYNFYFKICVPCENKSGR